MLIFLIEVTSTIMLYQNNFGSNNYKPYPPNNGNSYGNSYGNQYNQEISNNRLNEIEKSTKKFMHEQYEQNKISCGQ